MKKILIDITHPAHLHFFRNLIEQLIQNGHRVKLTGRDKDILKELANNYGLEIEIFGVAKKGVVNLGIELLHRWARILKIIQDFKPDLMIAIAGTFISIPGRITGIPVYIFYDTEHATISNLISYPFSTCIYVPQCYRKNIRWNHVRYNGYHELAYLHPKYFTPDPKILKEVNLRKGDTFTIVRFVGWEAAHDIGLNGFSNENKVKAVQELAKIGHVFITTEGYLPEELDKFRLALPVEKIHHLMAYASLIFGESATMASEAAVLGVPSIYVDPVGRGYTDEEEHEYGLVHNFTPKNQEIAIKKAIEILADTNNGKWKRKGQILLEDKIDVTGFLYKVTTT